MPYTINLTKATPAQGFVILGDPAGERAGSSVSWAGDVNGDNIDDIIVGAPYAGSGLSGEAYVVFGTTSGFGQRIGERQILDLTTLAPSEGFVIQGQVDGILAGWSVSSAGDVNDDGFDDLVVGAPRGLNNNLQTGEAYVVFGSASGFGSLVDGRSVIDLSTLSASEGFVLQSDTLYGRTGFSVSYAGDVNDDGVDDFVVGTPGGRTNDALAGEAYVVFGTNSGFGDPVSGRQVLDLDTLSEAEGFVIQGAETFYRAGISVSSAGDVNGDNRDDLIIGSPTAFATGLQNGEAYVVFGSSTGFGSVVNGRRVVDLGTLSPSEGFVVRGDADWDWAGFDVSSAGDVNGDGLDDLLIGAPNGDDGGIDAGEAYVVFGSETGFGALVDGRQVIDLATLSAAEGFIVQGGTAFDETGASVSSAGDINGDGIDDLIVGSPNNGADGAAYVLFGTSTGFGDAVNGRQVVDVANLSATDGFFIQGDEAGTSAGRSVSSAGDVNDDGFDDILVGSDGEDSGGVVQAGEAYVVFGFGTLFGTSGDDNDLTGSEDNELILGLEGADEIDGGDGDDTVVGGEGNDLLEGGLGFDVADYASSPTAIIVALANASGAIVEDGFGSTDSVSGIESFHASPFDDVLAGDGADNTFHGRDGSDVISGLGGNDSLVGNAGSDFIFGGAGSDLIDGGADDDTLSGNIMFGAPADGETDTFRYVEGPASLGFDVVDFDASNPGAGGDVFDFSAIFASRPGASLVAVADGAGNSWIGVGEDDQAIALALVIGIADPTQITDDNILT